MADNKLSYLDRNYKDYREDIMNVARQYYNDVFDNFNDAAIGTWLIDVLSDISDTLSYNIDRNYQETDIDSASSRNSLLNIAKTNGVKIAGPKSAIVEVELSCRLPINTSSVANSGNNLAEADESYCPCVRRGTLFSDGRNTFELTEDMDFSQQFDSNGFSNRKIVPVRDGNGQINGYIYTKLGIARAGYTTVYKKPIHNSDIQPFMKLYINDDNITNVESIICKDGSKINNDPSWHEFYVDDESYYDKKGLQVQRYFEVDNLIEQYRYGYVIDKNEDGNPIYLDDNGHMHYYDPVFEVIDEFTVTDENGAIVLDSNGEAVTEPIRFAAKGEWKKLKNKFTTEFDDQGNMVITFGPGLRNKYGTIPEDATAFTRYMMSRMEANDYLGVLPEAGTTVYVLYHVGGGDISNVGANTIKTITNLKIDIAGNCDDVNDDKKKATVKNTITVNNPTPSYGGKDAPSDEEVKYLIKYNAAEQNRCVTVKDYYSRISKIHPKYGCPFRHNVVEENNKVVIYTLGLDHEGHLMTKLSETVADNIKEYLKEYKCINDFVEIRSGKVINLSFDINVYVDKAYDTSEVISRIIGMVKEYMDIRRHVMGENIFLGDLEKEISKLDGVVNLIALRCYNNVGDGYSDNEIGQSCIDQASCCVSERNDYLGSQSGLSEVDLMSSDKTLYGSIDSMFEVKYPNKDIKIRIKTR